MEQPNEETIAAMQEAEDIAIGKVKSKGYDDVDEMIGDILKEECNTRKQGCRLTGKCNQL